MTTPYTAPTNSLTAFNCPLCGAYSVMTWFQAYQAALYSYEGARASEPFPTPTNHDSHSSQRSSVANVWISQCQHCKEQLLWVGNSILWPEVQGVGPVPLPDMPESIASDYLEARSIALKSPRSAAALMRLCIQKLCIHLGEKGDNLNAAIGNLVKKGLDFDVKDALDAVRVIGNNAVHPGEMNLKDDVDTAERLMELVNYVVDAMITQPKKRKELFAKVPAGARDAIAKRDSN